MERQIPRTPEGLHEISCKDLPCYIPRTEAEEKMFQKKVKNINQKAMFFLILAIVLSGVIFFSSDEGFAEPVWVSKLITFAIIGGTLIFVVCAFRTTFVPSKHVIRGQVGSVESVHWSNEYRHNSRVKTGYAVVCFPNQSVIKQVQIKKEKAMALAKGEEMLVISFNGRTAYGFTKDDCDQ